MENQINFVKSKKKGGEKKMKKVLLLTAAIALLAVPAMAGIKNSRHNLGNTGDYSYRATDGVTQICMFCHTPHNPQKNVPLWNRLDPQNVSFKEYTASATFSAGNKNAGLHTESISLFCLSCHDGSNGLFARVKNQRNEGTVAGNLTINATRTNIGANQDLTNDHPVNLRLSIAATDPTDRSDNWHTASEVTGNSLRLFRLAAQGSFGAGDDYVECASCHDPHRTDFTKFLRKNNASSSLCLTCHNK